MSKGSSCLEVRNVSLVRQNTALFKEINLTIKCGSFYVLLGANGAGKTTLLRLLAGLYSPTTGEIYLDGYKCLITSENAGKYGIVYCDQETGIFTQLSALDNFFIGAQSRQHFFYNRKSLRLQLKEFLDEIGFSIDLNKMAGELELSERYQLSIAKALFSRPQYLLIDEFETGLSAEENEKVFSALKYAASQGCAVVLASHVPTGVIKSADYMIMIEDNTVRTISMFRDWSLADIGKKLSSRVYTNIPRLPIYRGRQLLEVKNFSVGKLENVEFSLAQGEIIGLYNNRRSEIRKIFEMIAGLRIAGDGDIRFYPDRQHIKIGYLPEQDTVFDHMALPQNVTISNLDAVKKLPFIIDLKQEQIIYNDYAHRLGIRSKTKAPSKLSKGNRQKIMLARCLHSKCNLYLMDNPTNSLDSSSKIEFYNILAELSHRKAGILIASSNINELFYLCDRLLIVKDETDLRSFNTADTTLETLMYSI